MSCPVMDAGMCDVPKYVEQDPEWQALAAKYERETSGTSRQPYSGASLSRGGREVIVEQSHYAALYADSRLPAWQRVSFLAYARADTLGHAPFNGNRIAEILGIATGKVGREIAKAVDMGWLQDGSARGCLVIPTPMRSRYDAGDEGYCEHWRGQKSA